MNEGARSGPHRYGTLHASNAAGIADSEDASIVPPMTTAGSAKPQIASRSQVGREPEPRFKENLVRRLKRWGLGVAYALVPRRIGLLPRLLLLSVAHLLAPEAERERLPQDPVFYGKRGLIGISNDLP